MNDKANWQREPAIEQRVRHLLVECVADQCVILTYDERGSLTGGPTLTSLASWEHVIDDKQRETNRNVPGLRYVLEIVDRPESEVDAEIEAGNENPDASICHATAMVRPTAAGGAA